MTEFERMGMLQQARRNIAKGRTEFWTRGLLVNVITGLSPANTKGFRDYRAWTLEQLALAVEYLLGAGEPMLAGEVSVHEYWDAWVRELAIAVTAAHVLIFRIGSLEGEPRSIVLAARASDVKIERRSGLFGLIWPGIEVSYRTGRWSIRGFTGQFDPNPVLDAWRKAVGAAAAAR